MNIEVFKKYLKDHIGKGRTQEAFDALAKSLNPRLDSFNHYTILRNRFEVIRREAMLVGDQPQIEMTRLVADLVSFVNSLTSNDLNKWVSWQKNYFIRKYEFRYWAPILFLLLAGVLILILFFHNLIWAIILLTLFIIGLTVFRRPIFRVISNNKALLRRNRHYFETLNIFPDRVKILMEGDSWFCFPFVKDIYTHLAEYCNVYCLAEMGDNIKGILRGGDFKKVFEKEQPRVVLFNAGGFEIYFLYVREIIEEFDEKSGVFSEKAYQILDNKVMYYYNEALSELKGSQTKVIVNGYDYGMKKGKKAYKILLRWGISDPVKVSKALLDFFNQELEKMVSKYDNVYYLDLRNTLPLKEDWFDDTHPNSDGFLKISRKYIAKINEVLELDPA